MLVPCSSGARGGNLVLASRLILRVLHVDSKFHVRLGWGAYRRAATPAARTRVLEVRAR